ncbi:MAG TPA: hypothetical protein DEA08_23685 [Planctomycetes bacterium]|nr:hypothetical protein [Planctomycetota bacterium]
MGQVGVTHPYVARVLGFNPHNSPARVVVEVNEHRFEARLHFRRVRPESDGALATKLGLLELSEDTWRHEDPWMRKLVREVTGGARRIKVGVRVSPEGRELSLSESTWLFPGQRVSLRRAP